MRLVIFLLAVANLLFFAWTRGVFGEGAQGNPRAGEPLRAEQIRLLSNDRPPQESAEKEKEKPPPEPAKAATDTPVENDRCVVLNDVPQAEADALGMLDLAREALDQGDLEMAASGTIGR